jgi:hypothetical protein
VVPSSLLEPAYGDGDDPHPIGLMINGMTSRLGYAGAWLDDHGQSREPTLEEYLKDSKKPMHLDLNYFLFKNEYKALPQAMIAFWYFAAQAKKDHGVILYSLDHDYGDKTWKMPIKV